MTLLKGRLSRLFRRRRMFKPSVAILGRLKEATTAHVADRGNGNPLVDSSFQNNPPGSKPY
jgi:hypothetical protein